MYNLYITTEMEKKLPYFATLVSSNTTFLHFKLYNALYMRVCVRVLGIPNLHHKHVLFLL